MDRKLTALICSIALIPCSARAQVMQKAVVNTVAPVSGGSNPALVAGAGGQCKGSTFSSTSQACGSALTGTLNDWIYITANVASGTISANASGCTVSFTGDTQTNGTQHFWGKITSGGACTPSVSVVSGVLIQMVAVEITNTSGIDVHNGITNNGFTASVTCPTVTTGFANDLVLCGMADTSANTASFTAGSGFALGTTQPSGFGIAIEAGTVAVAGSSTPTASYGATGTLTSGTVAFKP